MDSFLLALGLLALGMGILVVSSDPKKPNWIGMVAGFVLVAIIIGTFVLQTFR